MGYYGVSGKVTAEGGALASCQLPGQRHEPLSKRQGNRWETRRHDPGRRIGLGAGRVLDFQDCRRERSSQSKKTAPGGPPGS